VILVEDVITSGGSILKTAETLRREGLLVTDAVVLVDRKQGGVEALAQQGIRVQSVLDIYEIMDVLKSNDFIDADTFTSVMRYLREN
jgi:uridine monophosphate synthetase